MVLIRLAHAADLPTLDEALRSLEGAAPVQNGAPRPNGAPAGSGNGNGGGASAVAQTRMPAGPGGAQTMRLVEAAPAPVAFVAPPQPVLETQQVPLKSLADIVALADAQRDIAFKVLVKSCIRLVRIEPGRIDVGLTSDAPKMLLNDLTTKLRAWTGRSWLVSLSKEEGGQTLAEMESTKRENAFLDAKSDPTVAAILARFPGAKIIDVRIPDAPEAETAEADVPVEPPADDDET
jgi:DNA polymerase-3 subunit gamma/tau